MAGIVRADTFRMNTIKSQDSDVTAATINSSGVMLPKTYAFRATKHVAINWTSGGGTGSAITFNNTSSNDAFNSGFDLSEIGSTGKIFIPVNGIYRVSASFLLNNNNSGGYTYATVTLNATDGSGGAPGTTLQNCYDYFDTNTHHLIKLNTIFKATSSDYITICKHDSFNYWGNGTTLSSATWGYNQLTCELIGTSQ